MACFHFRLVACCVLIGLFAAGTTCADEGSTSPDPADAGALPPVDLLGQGPINFSGSGAVTDAFKNLGVIFYGGGGPGSAAFVRSDSCNPTSPVLAGCASCPYLGPIGAEFVDPVSMEATAVLRVTSNAGCFNNDNSTALTAYDEKGGIVDTMSNGTGRNIISMSVAAKPTIIPQLPTLVTSVEFASVGEDDAGFAIDIFSFEACSVSGRVETPGGTPIPVTFVLLVTLNPTVVHAATITDINGWYCFPDVADGNYLVVAIFKIQQIGPFFGFVVDYGVDSGTPQRLDVVLGEVN
jgi:hypothetical protein